MLKLTTFLLFLLSFQHFFAQIDQYDQLKKQYEHFRKIEKQDSALFVAKEMNSWAFQNETDTSLRYAVSLRYVGNCFYGLEILDSTLFYYEKSLQTLINQNRSNSIDAASCYGNIGKYF